MRRHTFIAFTLAVVTTAGCSSPSGSRMTAFRSSGSGSSSYGSSNQYDADPPSAPNLAKSPVPATQTSSSGSAVKGISHGDDSGTPVQPVGLRRQVWNDYCRRAEACGQEPVCQDADCCAPQGAFCPAHQEGCTTQGPRGCFVPRERYCCPPREACVPQQHCTQRYCCPGRPHSACSTGCGSTGYGQQGCGPTGCADDGCVPQCCAPRSGRRSILGYLFCCIERKLHCGQSCPPDCHGSCGAEGCTPGQYQRMPQRSAPSQAAAPNRMQPPATPPVPANNLPSGTSVPQVPMEVETLPQADDPMGVDVELAPPPPAALQADPMPQAFHGRQNFNTGWNEPSHWPRLSGDPTSRIAAGTPVRTDYTPPKIEPAGWGR